MKKIFYLLLIPLFFCISQSCSKDNNSGTNWRTENEAYITKIQSNPKYKEVSIPQGPGSVYVIKDPESSGTGELPLYTSTVKVRYKGSLIDGTVFDDASDRTVELSVSGVVPGFAVALQNMCVGDKWEVDIPWQLGYGTSSPSSVIPSYSALIFEIELIEISQL